ncbi:MAG: hypothetical protein IKK11_03930 [Oscillospiraceae bacterium]|nr:hypothetical protein [Oscillospiraceae bacterium]
MKEYIAGIIGVAIISAVAISLVNKDSANGKLIKLLCGVLMCITVISPVVNISFRQIKGYLQDISVGAESYSQEGSQMAKEHMVSIIKSNTEAYILDKANLMGLRIAVEVELNDGNNPVPSNVTIKGEVSPYAKEVLSSYIESNLAIPKENQKWL